MSDLSHRLAGLSRAEKALLFERLRAGRAGAARPGVGASPRTAVEEVIAGLWAGMLGMAVPPGVDDDLCATGGSSLLAMRLVARLQSVFAVDLPPAAAFAAPTVAGLAAAVTAREAAPGRSEKIARALLRLRSMPPEARQQAAAAATRAGKLRRPTEG